MVLYLANYTFVKSCPFQDILRQCSDVIVLSDRCLVLLCPVALRRLIVLRRPCLWVLRWSLCLGELLRREAVSWLRKLLVRPDRLLLLPDPLEASSTAGRPVAAALFTNHRHPLCVDRMAGVPVRIPASVHALVPVEVPNEVALILLRANDSSLGCCLACSVDQLVISGMLRRSVVKSRVLISGVQQSPLRIRRVQCRLIVLLGME